MVETTSQTDTLESPVGQMSRGRALVIVALLGIAAVLSNTAFSLLTVPFQPGSEWVTFVLSLLLYTPGLSESILDGITRDTVITLAEDLGYTVHDTVSISRGELNTADELFFTGSAAEVTPIRKVDNVVIGDGTRGPVTEELQSKFFEVVERRTDEYDEWFDYV
ncbi:hypothetical protein EL22_28590 [Halostagnicola sp. A56]|nr:hypothetical protein EL22_28590 [Halostagnicola sp. A56]